MAKRYNEMMWKKHGDVPTALKRLDDEISGAEKAVANYDKFIKSGNWSDAIAKSLADTEARLKTFKSEREYLARQIENKVFITPLAVRDRLMSLSEILEKRLAAANEILKRLFFGKVLLTPKIDGKKKYYVASGEINLYGLVKPDAHGNSVLPQHGVEMPFIKFEVEVGK